MCKLTQKRADKEARSRKYPWLAISELKILTRGGYFDTEGVMRNEDHCIRCTCITHATGKRCKNFATTGMNVCKFHGGALKRKHERLYSAFIQNPTLASVYEAGAESTEILGIKEELSLLRSLLAGVIEQNKNLDAKGLKQLTSTIGEIRQLVKECTSTEIRLGQLIDIGKITIIVKSLANIIQKYVRDKEVLEKIAKDFDNIIWPAPVASTPQPEREKPVTEIPALPESVSE